MEVYTEVFETTDATYRLQMLKEGQESDVAVVETATSDTDKVAHNRELQSKLEAT